MFTVLPYSRWGIASAVRYGMQSLTRLECILTFELWCQTLCLFLPPESVNVISLKEYFNTHTHTQAHKYVIIDREVYCAIQITSTLFFSLFHCARLWRRMCCCRSFHQHGIRYYDWLSANYRLLRAASKRRIHKTFTSSLPQPLPLLVEMLHCTCRSLAKKILAHTKPFSKVQLSSRNSNSCTVPLFT